MKENKNENILLSNYYHDTSKNHDTEFYKNLVKVIIENATQNKSINKYYDVLTDLFKSKLLYEDEKNVIKNMLEYYELNGFFPKKEDLKEWKFCFVTEMAYENEILGTFRENPGCVYIMFDKLIKARKIDMVIKKNADLLKRIENCTVLPTTFIYTLEDYHYEKQPFMYEKIGKEVSYKYVEDEEEENIEYMDMKFEKGKVYTLVKNKYADDFFEVMALYNSTIIEGKNTCYISTKWSYNDVISKLLVIYSRTLDSSLWLDYTKIKKQKENSEKVNIVFANFKAHVGTRLQIFDNNSLALFSLNTLRQLLLGVTAKFQTSNGRNIDFLIIDTLENLRLEKDGFIEDNKQKIIKEYSNFIVRQSKMCYRKDFDQMSILVSTKCCLKTTFEKIQKYGIVGEYTTEIETISNSILEKYADNIFTLVLKEVNEKTITTRDGYFQIVRDFENKFMDEEIEISVSVNDCSIHLKHEKKDNLVEQITNTYTSQLMQEKKIKDKIINSNNLQKQLENQK